MQSLNLELMILGTNCYVPVKQLFLFNILFTMFVACARWMDIGIIFACFPHSLFIILVEIKISQ